MTFTTPCFVRVENVEEREELIQWCHCIGYTQKYHIAEGDLLVLVGLDAGCVDGAKAWDDVIFTLECWQLINCGTDVELFKALAAMNDENDREQWFTNGRDWVLCHDEFVSKKATAEEIIAHFKNKQQ